MIQIWPYWFFNKKSEHFYLSLKNLSLRANKEKGWARSANDYGRDSTIIIESYVADRLQFELLDIRETVLAYTEAELVLLPEFRERELELLSEKYDWNSEFVGGEVTQLLAYQKDAKPDNLVSVSGMEQCSLLLRGDTIVGLYCRFLGAAGEEHYKNWVA